MSSTVDYEKLKLFYIGKEKIDDKTLFLITSIIIDQKEIWEIYF